MDSAEIDDQSPRPDGRLPAVVARLRQPGLFVPLISGLGGVAVYSQTFMPGIGLGDWGEMATVPHILGIAHPTDYPAYILMAWLAELLPIGRVTFRANLLSAVYVAITLATLSLISLRLGVRPVLPTASAEARMKPGLAKA